MPEVSWQAKLDEKLGPPAAATDAPPRMPRVAIVGVGNELHGDDAAGVAVARALEPLSGERLLVLDAGPAPENVTGALRRFAPDFILLVDAADMGEEPGTVRWLEWESVANVGGSTHSLPLTVVVRYLIEELGCEIGLLGIQPLKLPLLGRPLSDEVQAAVGTVVRAIGERMA